MASAQIGLFDLKENTTPTFTITKKNYTNPTVVIKRQNIIETQNNSQPDLQATLNHIFKTEKEETRLTLARRCLGDAVREMSDEELESHIVEFQYLLDGWLDEFEKQLLGDKTLKQLLKEG